MNPPTTQSVDADAPEVATPEAPGNGSGPSAGSNGATPPAPDARANRNGAGPTSPDPAALVEAVDRARERMTSLDEDIRKRVDALMKARDAFLAAGVTEMVRRLKSDGRSKSVLFELVDDPLIYAVLMELGIVRPDVLTRVARAMERIKPYVKSHGGDIELVRVDEESDGKVAYVRFHGSCNGCSMSNATLRDGVGEAIRGAVPEVVRVEEVKDAQPVAGLVQLTVARPNESHGWIEGPAAEEIAEGEMSRVHFGDADVLLVRREGKLFAYRNECPHQGMPLHDGEVCDDVVECPWHGYRFDLRNGECLNMPQVQLDPFPLRVTAGRIWVRPTAQ